MLWASKGDTNVQDADSDGSGHEYDGRNWEVSYSKPECFYVGADLIRQCSYSYDD